ncbi:MAG: hypothetical protein RL173_1026 [Fibrobacterota bacterium]|jgi:putative DNA primase/helicase
MNEDMARKIMDIVNPKQSIFGAPVIPYPEPVNGNTLLTRMFKTIKRHISCDDEVVIIATLWSTFTWVIDNADCAPIAIITAPDRQCGKTQTLSIFGELCPRPLQASNISSASLYHVIENCNPTLLIDEADTFLSRNNHLIGILNSGHTRKGASVIRTNNKGETKIFSTWGAKAISGIGNMPETIMDRGIILPLRRKLPEESISPLRESEKDFKTLRSALARWSADNGSRISEMPRIDLPKLNSRQNDNWRPLLAIAELAGGEWLQYAKAAAIKYADYSISSCTHNSLDLLSDIYAIFEVTKAERIYTKDLIPALCAYKPKAWGNFKNSAPITDYQLAQNLSHFHIRSRSTRINGDNLKGYYRKHFQDAFLRYISM